MLALALFDDCAAIVCDILCDMCNVVMSCSFFMTLDHHFPLVIISETLFLCQVAIFLLHSSISSEKWERRQVASENNDTPTLNDFNDENVTNLFCEKWKVIFHWQEDKKFLWSLRTLKTTTIINSRLRTDLRSPLTSIWFCWWLPLFVYGISRSTISRLFIDVEMKWKFSDFVLFQHRHRDRVEVSKSRNHAAHFTYNIRALLSSSLAFNSHKEQ